MFQEEVAARGKQAMNITIDLVAWIMPTSTPTTAHDIQELDVLVAEMQRSACKSIQSPINSYTTAYFTTLSTVCLPYASVQVSSRKTYLTYLQAS
jgi:hypothetical protein